MLTSTFRYDTAVRLKWKTGLSLYFSFPGKEFKAAIVMPDMPFDANLNKPGSSQFLELKKFIEESVQMISILFHITFYNQFWQDCAAYLEFNFFRVFIAERDFPRQC
jgi:hypothetical protein